MSSQEETKQCLSCQQFLPRAEFYSGRINYRLPNRCRTCRKAYQRSFRLRKKEQTNTIVMAEFEEKKEMLKTIKIVPTRSDKTDQQGANREIESKNTGKRKDKLPSKYTIFFHWRNFLLKAGIVENDEDLVCWACKSDASRWIGCSKVIEAPSPIQPVQKIAELLTEHKQRGRPKKKERTIKEKWDNSSLVRCHILSEDLGGPPVVENLFLLCKECHDLAPNTTNREIFLTWVLAQDHIVRKIGKLKAAINSLNLSQSELNDFYAWADYLSKEEIISMLEGNVGVHFGAYGPSTTFSSVAGILYNNWKYHKEL